MFVPSKSVGAEANWPPENPTLLLQGIHARMHVWRGIRVMGVLLLTFWGEYLCHLCQLCRYLKTRMLARFLVISAKAQTLQTLYYAWHAVCQICQSTVIDYLDGRPWSLSQYSGERTQSKRQFKHFRSFDHSGSTNVPFDRFLSARMGNSVQCILFRNNKRPGLLV